jgi:membrane protease YdiL (CAAX protease family)
MQDNSQDRTLNLEPPDPIPAELVIEPPARPWGLWVTLGLSLAIYAATFIAQNVVAIVFLVLNVRLNPQIGLERAANSLALDGDVIGLAAFAGALVGLPLIALFCTIRKGMTVASYLRVRMPSWSQLIPWLVAIILFAVAVDSLSMMLGREIVPDVMKDYYRSTDVLPLFVVVIVIAAPIFEEALFRGFLFEGIRYSRLGPISAALITSALWAVIHLQYGPYEITIIFVMGLILAAARLSTDSIVVPCAMHALANAIATVEVAVLAGS